jgi:tetratricopeptide (TPR) repeat protein
MKRLSQKARLILLLSSASLCGAASALAQTVPPQTPPPAQTAPPQTPPPARTAPAPPAQTAPPAPRGTSISAPGNRVLVHPDWNIGGAGRADTAGDAAWAKGDFAEAEADYRKAVDLWPEDTAALYGLGQCAARVGDPAAAVVFYRQAVYRHDVPPPQIGYSDNRPYRLLEYAQLLAQTGEKDEALRIYQHAVGLLNYEDGVPNLKVPLPEFGAGTHPTAAQFRAMILVGIAIDREGWDNKRVEANLDEAVALMPDSPIPYYYRAKYDEAHAGKRNLARPDFERAEQLGDAKTVAAAQEYLSHLLPQAPN